MSSPPPMSLEQAAVRSGAGPMDKTMRDWLSSVPTGERINFLKQLWPLNFRYALQLTQAAQLPRHESQSLFQHWLQQGHHTTASDLLRYFLPILGERRLWKIIEQEQLSPAMTDFINYHHPRQNKPRG